MITKLDLMDEGTDARDILENKLLPLRRGEGPDALFPSGGNKAAVRGEPEAKKENRATAAECWKVVIRRPDTENKGEARKRVVGEKNTALEKSPYETCEPSFISVC